MLGDIFLSPLPRTSKDFENNGEQIAGPLSCHAGKNFVLQLYILIKQIVFPVSCCDTPSCLPLFVLISISFPSCHSVTVGSIPLNFFGILFVPFTNGNDGRSFTFTGTTVEEQLSRLSS